MDYRLLDLYCWTFTVGPLLFRALNSLPPCLILSDIMWQFKTTIQKDMAGTFEFVLHFVGCVTVTVSPNQIIIIIIIIKKKLKTFIFQ